MLADLDLLAFGPVNPVLVLGSATLGCLLGIILAIRAQKYTGRQRVRLLLYSSVSIGVTAVWQANVLALVGLDVPGSIVRYNPVFVGISLAVAVIACSGAVFVLGYGRIGFARMFTAGALFGVGVAGAHYLLLRSLEVGGTITYNEVLFVASVTMAMGVAGALLWFMVGTRRLGAAIRASLAIGLAVCAVHYVGLAAVEVHLGVGAHPFGADGLSPMLLALPTMVLGACLTAMMWFFTVGTATGRDLQAIFDPLDDANQIEPWMIEHVTARIALTTTGEIPILTEDGEPTVAVSTRATYVPGSMPIAGAFAAPIPGRRAPGPRPTPGITPVWRSMPVWGRPEVTPGPEHSRTWALRNVLAGRTTATPNSAARNPERANTRDRATNSRHGDLPTSAAAPVSPAGAPATTTGAYPDPSTRRTSRTTVPPASATPLPRRNPRP